jgi:long-chain acyl-CoA synthetase
MYPNQEYRIVNGELQLKGDNLISGYVGDDEENANAYEDGWFRTGDLARVDQDGFLYIIGRLKEVIVLSSGENISPAELEEKFNDLPIVQCSQVFEDIAENGKHILALEVVLRPTETAKLQVKDVKEYAIEQLKKVNETLLPYQRVSRIVVRDTDFERTPAMKIKRYKKCN